MADVPPIPFQGKGRKRGGGKNVMNVPGKKQPEMGTGKSAESKYRASQGEKASAVAGIMGAVRTMAGTA